MRAIASDEMSALDMAAPSHARRLSTPASIIGGAISSVRSTVQPSSL
jgi:hypothetical protein